MVACYGEDRGGYTGREGKVTVCGNGVTGGHIGKPDGKLDWRKGRSVDRKTNGGYKGNSDQERVFGTKKTEQ